MSEAISETPTKALDQQVREAANMVAHGTVGIEDVRPTGDLSLSEQAFRDAVRERISERYDREPDTDQQSDQEVTGIDWRALFEEFGMHTPNAVGDLAVSPTKLRLAVSVSTQPVSGDPETHIHEAVESGQLIAETESMAEGGETIRGYRLGSDLA